MVLLARSPQPSNGVRLQVGEQESRPTTAWQGVPRTEPSIPARGWCDSLAHSERDISLCLRKMSVCTITPVNRLDPRQCAMGVALRER